MTTSIRDVLIVIAVLGLTLSAMRTGGFLASTTVFLIGLISILRAVAAVVAPKREQIAARGFVIPVLIYASSLVFLGKAEFATREPILLTSQVLAMLKTGAFGGSGNADTWEFMAAGHAAISLALGFLGSFFATSLQVNEPAEGNCGEPSHEPKSPTPT